MPASLASRSCGMIAEAIKCQMTNFDFELCSPADELVIGY